MPKTQCPKCHKAAPALIDGVCVPCARGSTYEREIWLLWCEGEVIGAFYTMEAAKQGLHLAKKVKGQYDYQIGPVPLYDEVRETLDA